jgi:catechol 2,3-dioxygenase-like lactoylglutathione lyase family enzyme
VWDGTVEEALALLARNGIAIEAGPGPRLCARGESTSVYFRDPDGNLVEFTVY